MNTFRWFALFDEYSINVAQNGRRSALSAQQSMGSGAIIRKSASTASGGESTASGSGSSGYVNSAALFRPVLSDYAASRAMFAVPPALRHVLTYVPRNQRSESDIHLIFKSSTPSMYIIVRGTCDVFRTENLAPGRYWRRVLRPLAAGDLFGDLGVRTDYDSIIERQVGIANQVKLQFLAQSPVGRHMTDEERQDLAQLGVVHEYARGEVIVHEGEQVKHVLAVRSGTVRVVKYVEFWYQRIDILPHDAPIDGKSVVENLPVSRRTALATPKYMQWHRRPDNAHCYRQDRGDKIEGEFLVIGELHSGDFTEEQTVRITPQSTVDVAKHQSLIRNVASRHVVDANAVFYSQATYIADEPCEIIKFPNVEFLKVASDETLTAMQTIVNMRPTVDVQVNEYLRHRAYGKVKQKVVSEVLGRQDREQTEKFFAMETQHVRTATSNRNRTSNAKSSLTAPNIKKKST
ncbi:hypothetical protein BCR44DRAFT_1498009 [Catenaria anguillulae PL171]|uniref:Cyclic nucleotide-binding domain-containing protein n=1 Tax=Catenaria anguillulae PL171 TaxID=765915 RepID=A0A1Y2HSI7_9FUNG|nr:hypothetical protein BCR44DRAFT_1498009 [Catenaria anguillulae PL171]